MNKIKLKVLTGTVMVGMAFSATAMSATASAGLEACADAMMDEISGTAEKPAYKVRNLKKEKRDRLSGDEVFYLDAMTKESEKVIGRFDCVVNRRAEVIELTRLPLDAKAAHKRSIGMN